MSVCLQQRVIDSYRYIEPLFVYFCRDIILHNFIFKIILI